MLLMHWLRGLKHRPQRIGRLKNSIRSPRQRISGHRGTLDAVGIVGEVLEDRTLLTTTVFLDFGFAFPAGGLPVTNVNSTSVGGPSVFDSGGNTLVPLLTSVQTAGIDLNGDTVSDISDAQALSTQVLQATRQIFSPFNIFLVSGSSGCCGRMNGKPDVLNCLRSSSNKRGRPFSSTPSHRSGVGETDATARTNGA